MATLTIVPQHPAPQRAPRSSAEGEERVRRTDEAVARLRGETSPAERQRLVDDLIEANVSVARSMAARYRNRGVDLDDLEQVALLGLTKAAQRFDAGAGHDFLSYAVPTVRGELRRHFRDSGWMIRPPRRVQELQARIGEAQDVLLAELGRAPRPSEIAAHIGVATEDVVEALSADGCFRPASIDSTAGDGTTIADLLRWDDRGIESLEARLVLDTVVAGLAERERRILQWRFVDEHTQQEIADQVGLTQAQVSRILARVLGRLRSHLTEPVPAA